MKRGVPYGLKLRDHEVVDLAELFLNFVIEYCIFAKTKKFVKLF